MITAIEIKNTATYDAIGQKIEPLAKVNFFYGSNGSGKTTLSRIIENQGNYPNCSINWTNNYPIKAFVYNRDFVDSNFNSRSELKGIFTLGKEAKETRDKIELKKQELSETQLKIQTIETQLNSKNTELTKEKSTFEDKCWEGIKKKYDTDFGKAFEGFKSSKLVFSKKCLDEVNNVYSLLTHTELKQKSDKIFHGSTEKLPLAIAIDFSQIISFENDNILNTKIIGKQDVNIAELINKLGNSDWVKQGKYFLQNSDDICPFCQQATITDALKLELEEYFNETYTQQLNQLKKLKQDYEHYVKSKISDIEKNWVITNQYIDKQKLKNEISHIQEKFNTNLIKLDGKIKEPSLIVELNSLNENFKEVEGLIISFSRETIAHNTLISNIVKEREKLKNEIWRFIIEELKVNINNYNETNNKIKKTIEGLKNSNLQKQGFLKNINSEISELEQSITSVKPTIDAINTVLQKFNFTGFKLAEDSNQIGNYLIVRNDNTIVRRTLSEGEKTFITFIYFYYLTKGSFNNNAVTENRVIVFDDPISSLDSDVLFMVSSLIRGLISDVKNNKNSTVKQIFILTHNTYFYKEVSYRKDHKNQSKDETFWIVRKNNNISKVLGYEYNPIKTSYEFLWDEIKEKNKATIQNTLRRILENYFNFQGKNLHDLAENFENEEEQNICKSLISWIHDGSHHILDDFHVDNSHETIDRYLFVFKDIFEKTGHIEHYKMMTGEE